MTDAKKVEIIVPRGELQAVRRLFETHDLAGYTVIEGLQVRCGRGAQDGSRATNTRENVLVICTMSSDEFAQIKEEVRVVLKRSGGLCLLGDVQSVRHHGRARSSYLPQTRPGGEGSESVSALDER